MNEFDSEKTSLVSGQPLFLILCVLVLLLPCLHRDAKGQQKDRPENEPKVNENRVVILTFDDASASHYSIVRPLLLKYQFGATFFITEGWDFSSNKKDYLTWEQIRTRTTASEPSTGSTRLLRCPHLPEGRQRWHVPHGMVAASERSLASLVLPEPSKGWL
jgi:hypothetical protein